MKNIMKNIGIQGLLRISFALIILIASISTINKFSMRSSEDSTKALEETLLRAAVQCYAIEGSYPPDLNYLRDNYSIILDEERYFYHYDIQGSNITPNIVVIRR